MLDFWHSKTATGDYQRLRVLQTCAAIKAAIRKPNSNQHAHCLSRGIEKPAVRPESNPWKLLHGKTALLSEEIWQDLAVTVLAAFLQPFLMFWSCFTSYLSFIICLILIFVCLFPLHGSLSTGTLLNTELHQELQLAVSWILWAPDLKSFC